MFSTPHFSFSCFARSAALCSSIAYLHGRRRVRKTERNDQFQYTHQQHAMIAHITPPTHHVAHTRGLFSSFIMLSCSSLVVLVHTKIRAHTRRPSPELSTCSYPRPFLLISISKLDDSVLEIVQRLALNSPFPGAAGAALVKNRASRELVGKER